MSDGASRESMPSNSVTSIEAGIEDDYRSQPAGTAEAGVSPVRSIKSVMGGVVEFVAGAPRPDNDQIHALAIAENNNQEDGCGSERDITEAWRDFLIGLGTARGIRQRVVGTARFIGELIDGADFATQEMEVERESMRRT